MSYCNSLSSCISCHTLMSFHHSRESLNKYQYFRTIASCYFVYILFVWLQFQVNVSYWHKPSKAAPFRIILSKHPVKPLVAFTKHSICLNCLLWFGAFLVPLCCSSSYVIVILPFHQDQTSQSTDPSRTNPSRSSLRCATNTSVKAPHTSVLQTPPKLQTGPVLVE